MKRQRHIRTHVMATLIGLTCGVLLVVILVFNLSIHGYIRARAAAQLDSMSQNAAEMWHGGMRDKRGMEPFLNRPDRQTGMRGSAVIVDEEGRLLSVLSEEDEVSQELADSLAGKPIGEMDKQIVTLPSGTYAVSALRDPNQADKVLLVYVDMTAITAFSRQVNLILLAVILAAIALSVLLSRRFARELTSPVQTLSDFAREIGSGTLETRELSFPDVEFNTLAESMNHMVTELRDAKQKQETFFQNVSHELRTPLTSIRGNAEGIVCGLMEPKQAGRVILSESDKLGEMVEELLCLSRMGRSRPAGAAPPLDMREVLSLCVSEQRTAAEAKGIRFSFDFDETPVMLSIREQDAQRLFGNLLSNALRYAGTEVRLCCRREGTGVFASVADDGPGVLDADLPHVFERFYKGAGGKHGIGLAIAQSVAETYHGEISVHNDGGAVFEVRFHAGGENGIGT